MKKTLTFVASLGLLLTGCTMEITPTNPEPDAGSGTGSEGTIRFNIGMAENTKSSISIDEVQLADVNIYAYCDGSLYSHAYSTTPETVSLKLRKDCSYNLYAVANTSEMAAYRTEEEFIREMKVSITKIGDMDGRNLLAWSYKGYTLSSSSADLDMRMTRLYSKINFRLERGTLQGLEVTSVVLHQAASTVHPFMEGGSRALSEAETMDGDHASAADLQKLNTTGEGVFFYTLENMQGTLLPDNGDPWKKTPENIQARSTCTYIEVQGTFKEGFFYTGNVTYRFYLGMDNTTNFDIPRNSEQFITLSMTGDGLKEISWKIDANVDVTSGFVTGEITHGMHAVNDLYIGEIPELTITMEQELIDYLHNDVTGVTLKFIGGTGKADDLTCSALTGSNGVYRSRLACNRKTEGVIWLMDKDGSQLMPVCPVKVQTPVLMLGESLAELSDHKVNRTQLDNMSMAGFINGGWELVKYGQYWEIEQRVRTPSLYLFLTDRQGNNLNSATYGFNNELFDLSAKVKNASVNAAYAQSGTSLTRLASSTGKATWKWTPTFRHDGTDYNLSKDLSAAVFNENSETMCFQEGNFGIVHEEPVWVEALPIGVYVQDATLFDGTASSPSYYEAYVEMFLVVKNPSNIALRFDIGWYWDIRTNDRVYKKLQARLEWAETYVKNYRKYVNLSSTSTNVRNDNSKFFDMADAVVLTPGVDNTHPMKSTSHVKYPADGYIKENDPVYVLPLYNFYSSSNIATYRVKDDVLVNSSNVEKEYFPMASGVHIKGRCLPYNGASGNRGVNIVEKQFDCYMDPDNIYSKWSDDNLVQGAETWDYMYSYKDFSLVQWEDTNYLGCGYLLDLHNGTKKDIVKIQVEWDEAADKLKARTTDGSTLTTSITIDVTAKGKISTRQSAKDKHPWVLHRDEETGRYSCSLTLNGSYQYIDNSEIKNTVNRLCSNHYYKNNHWQPVPVKWEDKHSVPYNILVKLTFTPKGVYDKVAEITYPANMAHDFRYASTGWKGSEHDHVWSGTVPFSFSEGNSFLVTGESHYKEDVVD